MKHVKAVELGEQTVLSEGVDITPDESVYSLNIVGIYQDAVSRNWGRQVCQRATQLAGEERVQNMWYNANSLSDTGILLHAVHATLVADVIVVSIYAVDELPLALYVWFDAWRQHRLSRAGALVALVGVAESLDSQSVRTLKYLQTVARKAKLEFIPREFKRQDTSCVSFMELLNGTN
jgi:hypothetical protein